MSEVGKVTYKISGDNSSFESDVNHSKNIASRAASAIGGAFVTAMAAASAAVIAGATAGVKYNAQMEQYATSFEVMLGSSEKALAKIAELKDFAAKTPFEMTDLADATKVMLGFGIAEDKASDMLKVLGDISQGDSTKLSSLTLAFSQMSSTGRLMGQDLLQMINAGFNPLNEISKKTGETMAEVKARMEKGAISAEEVTEAFKSATAEGGLFYGSMDKQSKTFNGQMSTLKDNAMSFLGELTTGLTDIAKNEALPFINEELGKLQTAFTEGGFDGLTDALGEVLGDLSEKLVESIPEFTQFTADLVIGIMEGLAESSDVIASGAGDLIRILGQALIDFVPLLLEIGSSLVTGLVKGIADNATLISDGAAALMVALPNALTALLPTLIPAAVKIVIELIKGMIDNVPMLVDSAIALMEGITDGLLEALPLIVDAAPEIILSLIDALIDNLPKLLESGADIIVAVTTGVIQAIPQLIAAVPQIFIALVKAFGALAPKIWQIGKDIVSGIWEGIESAWGTLVDNFTRKMGGLIKSIKRMLGINSPSTVFKSMFVNVVKGSEIGFDDEFPNLERKMSAQFSGLIGSAESSVSPAAAINVAGSKTIQIEVPLAIDGREVARATAFYTGEQMSWWGA